MTNQAKLLSLWTNTPDGPPTILAIWDGNPVQLPANNGYLQIRMIKRGVPLNLRFEHSQALICPGCKRRAYPADIFRTDHDWSKDKGKEGGPHWHFECDSCKCRWCDRTNTVL